MIKVVNGEPIEMTAEEIAAFEASRAVPIETIKAQVWEKIKAYRDNLVENGGFKVGAHWYHSDLISRTRYLGLLLLGSNIPTGQEWKTMDNGYVPITQAWVQQVFAAITMQDAALMEAAKVHRAAMEASSDPAAYDWMSTGWPETYTGA